MATAAAPSPNGLAAFTADDAANVARLKDNLIKLYQPIDFQETCAIERVAHAQNAVLRCARLEANLFVFGTEQAFAEQAAAPPAPASDTSYWMAAGFLRQSAQWKVFLRYQARTERLYRSALFELERLTSLREQLPEEPDDEPEAEPVRFGRPHLAAAPVSGPRPVTRLAVSAFDPLAPRQ